MDLNALSAAFEQNHAATAAAIAALREEIAEVKDIRGDLDRVEARLNRPGNGGSSNRAAGDLTAQYAAIGSFARTGDEGDLKALSVGDDTGGGYFVHPQLSDTIAQRVYDQSPIRRLARIVPIGAGGSFEEPEDTSDVEATWIGEEEQRPETDAGDVGLLNIPLQEIYANQKITQRLLDDAGFDVGAWAIDKIADKFGRSEGEAYVTGSGHKRPKGFMTYPTATGDDLARARHTLQKVKTGTAATITADSLTDLFWSLRATHRQNATWLMSSATANKIDKLKDGNGQHLWRASMTAGAPNSLLGRPVEFDEAMPGVGAGLLPVAFGNWKRGYTIIERPGYRPLRNPYLIPGAVMLYVYRRVGGAVSDFDAIKLLSVEE